MAKSIRNQDDFIKTTGTVIGQGFTINAAVISGPESMRVDGTVVGDIELEGALHLSETGVIEGSVKSSSARIAGGVTGDVTCSATLHLASTASVVGDILTDSMIVDNGAVFHGQCQTHNTKSELLTYSSY